MSDKLELQDYAPRDEDAITREAVVLKRLSDLFQKLAKTEESKRAADDMKANLQMGVKAVLWAAGMHDEAPSSMLLTDLATVLEEKGADPEQAAKLRGRAEG